MIYPNLSAVPMAVRMRDGYPLTLDQCNFVAAVDQALTGAGATDAQAIAGSWATFDSRFLPLPGTDQLADLEAGGDLRFELGLTSHYQAVEEADGYHLQLLAGSTSVDLFQTFVDPSI
ncbi:MAG: hypothetical protein KAJ37_09650, partial [Candidatus Krumholzibacteria bacterium]|nr:hypothetical protein [Candidatus Krumholzibacteria bacterium]